jgi:hypothetical protein
MGLFIILCGGSYNMFTLVLFLFPLYNYSWAGFILSGAIFAASLKDMRGGAKSGDGDAAPAADEAKVDEEAPAAEADAPMKDEE